jgi:hypothetical protein
MRLTSSPHNRGLQDNLPRQIDRNLGISDNFTSRKNVQETSEESTQFSL